MLPKELEFGGVYLPPILIVIVLAILLAWLTAFLLNKYRISRFFVLPRIVYVSIISIYLVLIGTFVVPI